jgi:polyisoprenoid-binding protein YceI
MRKLALALTLGALSVLPVQAADVYSIDPVHSDASFSIRHFVSNVRGRFNDFSGTVNLDPAKMTSSSVTFTIKASSIDTGNEGRDKHLRTADFFDVEKFPEITFKSTSIAAAGKDQYSVTGDFTMHGVTKRITLPVTFLGNAKDSKGNEKAGFETSATLNRNDYGISYDPKGLVLGEDVKVSVSIEANKAKPEAKK